MTVFDRFRELHAREQLFVMPNPWDVGSAKVLAALGFEALATTSAGFALAIGKRDQTVTRDELVEHVGQIAAATPLPVNVDSEQLYPGDAGGVAETVRLLADAGAAGCSIEDYDPGAGRIEDVAVAAERVGVAAEAARGRMVLTARAENHLYDAGDLDDTIARLVAYREAGADVVYAPGLTALGRHPPCRRGGRRAGERACASKRAAGLRARLRRCPSCVDGQRSRARRVRRPGDRRGGAARLRHVELLRGEPPERTLGRDDRSLNRFAFQPTREIRRL